MAPDVDTLPDDPKLLKSVLRAVLEDNRKLEDELALLKRAQFGRKSERIVNEQLLMPFAPIPSPPPPPEPPAGPEGASDTAPAPSGPTRKKNGHGRRPLPSHLERKGIDCDIPEGEKTCPHCHEKLKKIAEQIVERLEREPATLVVQQFIKAVYACVNCHECVKVAETPSAPIEKGLAGPGLLAQTIVNKYADHLPLERQSSIYAREGVELAPSTLGEWIGVSADLLKPIVDELELEVRRSKVIHFDETRIRVMEPGRGETRPAGIAAYIGDDEHPGVVYRFSPNLSKDDLYAFLGSFEGFLQADADRGYDKLYTPGKRIEAACWAHARRQFFDSIPTDPVNARGAIAWIRTLYDVEDVSRGRPPNEILALRQERALPVLVKFEPWLKEIGASVLPKSPMGRAIGYTLRNWAALRRYTEDGRLAIDNNVAERALRQVAVGRKNWLFAGSDDGGRRAAIHLTLVQTCKRVGVNPWEYLRDVLMRVSTTPESAVADLMPHRWKAAHPAKPPAPVE